MKPPSQAAIGRALRISPSAVTKFKAMGMPVDSVQNAHAWRQNNIRPSVQTSARRRANEYLDPMSGTAVLAAAQELMIVAATALEAGKSILAMMPTLRAAMAAVPTSHRDDLMVSALVMDVLVADVASFLPPDNDDGATCSDAAMTDNEAEELGRFWYRVAAGEIVPPKNASTRIARWR